MRINEIFTSAQNNCAVNISLVNLFSFSSPDEALTVQARPPQTGIVYFKTFKSNRDLDGQQMFVYACVYTNLLKAEWHGLTRMPDNMTNFMI